jgi:polypeptide N-acetylgalactosaminyltransferase
MDVLFSKNWLYSREGEMRRDNFCMDYFGGPDVVMLPCHRQKGNQLWRYEDEVK